MYYIVHLYRLCCMNGYFPFSIFLRMPKDLFDDIGTFICDCLTSTDDLCYEKFTYAAIITSVFRSNSKTSVRICQK